MRGNERSLRPTHAVAREHRAHFFDELVHRHLLLRLGLLLQIGFAVGLLQLGEFRAGDQIPHQHAAVCLLVGALDDRAWAAAPVGVAKLLAEVVIDAAQIKLGADVAFLNAATSF